MAKKSKAKDFIFAVGRRKSAIARVRLFRGKGENKANETPAGDYFNLPGEDRLWAKPFEVTGTEGKYFASAKIEGGGKTGHLDAFILGVSRALAQTDEAFKNPLRLAGLLTRDARVRERRKVGTGGKARRKKQSPKR